MLGVDMLKTLDIITRCDPECKMFINGEKDSPYYIISTKCADPSTIGEWANKELVRLGWEYYPDQRRWKKPWIRPEKDH